MNTKLSVMVKLSTFRFVNGICRGISTRWLFIHCFQIELEFRSVDFCGGRKTGVPGEKPPRSRVENQQRTQPTHDNGSGNRTQDTLVGGERANHCATPQRLPGLISAVICLAASYIDHDLMIIAVSYTYNVSNCEIK